MLGEVTKVVNAYSEVLYPHGKFMQNFDNFVAVLLLFTTTITPFEIAYLEMSIGPLFCINRLVDCGFFLDVSANPSSFGILLPLLTPRSLVDLLPGQSCPI
jgi:hypothetical protein